jgi:flagellar hook-basal body complex protein FliE
VLGARGNSGTILAELLRGLADQLAGQPPATGPELAAALQKAADAAYAAVGALAALLLVDDADLVDAPGGALTGLVRAAPPHVHVVAAAPADRILAGLGAIPGVAVDGVWRSVGAPAVGGADAGSGTSFGSALADGLAKVQALNDTSDSMAAKAATGDLKDVHDYMIASTEASLATELTVAVRNKAIDSFNEIMRMPV